MGSYSQSIVETSDNRAEVAEGGTYIGSKANVSIANTQNLTTNFDQNVADAFNGLVGAVGQLAARPIQMTPTGISGGEVTAGVAGGVVTESAGFQKAMPYFIIISALILGAIVLSKKHG